jgi:hypothetical protein
MKNFTIVRAVAFYAAPSFAAVHRASHSAKFVGKQTYKVTKTSEGNVGVALLKFVL